MGQIKVSQQRTTIPPVFTMNTVILLSVLSIVVHLVWCKPTSPPKPELWECSEDETSRSYEGTLCTLSCSDGSKVSLNCEDGKLIVNKNKHVVCPSNSGGKCLVSGNFFMSSFCLG